MDYQVGDMIIHRVLFQHDYPLLSFRRWRITRRKQMSYMGRSLGPQGYKVVQMPKNENEIRASFENLPTDPYYQKRSRRFSQYILYHEHSDWKATPLERRPFIQSTAYNNKAGGFERHYEPITDLNPSPYVSTIAQALDLNKDEVFQVNFHTWRSFVNGNDSVTIVPEGPHRDGHHIIAVTVWERKNIRGGESRIYSLSKQEVLYETILDGGRTLIIRDQDVLHSALDIHACDENGGHRDIWVIALNPWSDRRYGRDHEERARA